MAAPPRHRCRRVRHVPAAGRGGRRRGDPSRAQAPPALAPGAIGVSGTYEKHVALEAAYELRRLLEATGRYRVAMTRARDVFIPLEQRVAIAQEHGASL